MSTSLFQHVCRIGRNISVSKQMGGAYLENIVYTRHTLSDATSLHCGVLSSLFIHTSLQNLDDEGMNLA